MGDAQKEIGMKNLITCLTVSLLSGAAFATTWTVDDDGPADFNDIQSAIDAASDGDVVIVSPGIYTSTSLQVVDMSGKLITLKSTDGPSVTIIDAQGQRRGLVCSSGENRDTIIDGFTIRNGFASPTGAQAGGNIFCEASSPTILNCNMESGEALFGGGIYCIAGGPSVQNCTIANNIASGSGGGGNFFNSTLPIEITGCTFFENECAPSYSGGGMYLHGCTSATVTNCTFESNSAGDGSGSEGGGGMYIHAGSSPNAELYIADSIFTTNHAGSGGAISILTYNEASSTVLVNGCTILNNTAEYSGGGGYANSLVDLTPSNVSFVNCEFESNFSNGVGGGLWVRGAINIDDCEIHGNWVPANSGLGGGLYSYVYNSNSPPPIMSNTYICGNMPDQISGPLDDIAGNYVSQDCPTGACCYGGDMCQQLNETDCYDVYPGGTWLGWGSNCEDCLVIDQGACCLVDELRMGCVITDPSACFGLGGKWMGSGSDCKACIPEPQPGACCTPTGCTILREDLCANIGGQWLGDDTDCGQCPEISACCLCNGCIPMWEQDCLTAGGDWLAGSGCDECHPSSPTGVCCLASGCIMNASEEDCVTNLGEWLGPNGSCSDCPQACFGDLNGDWVVDIQDLLILISHYGICP